MGVVESRKVDGGGRGVRVRMARDKIGTVGEG